MHDIQVAEIVECMRRAIKNGTLTERFRAADVRKSCPGWDYRTYNNFLPKYRLGNPGGHTVYFKRNPDGSYSLLD